MAETSFSVTYEGPAVEDGRMQVADLAPALLAMATLVKDANSILRPSDPPVTLEIRATEPGSFIVEMVLSQPELVAQVVDIFTSDTMNALVNLKEVLFVSGGGLLWLVKQIRRRGIDRVEASSEPGRVVIVLGDDRIEVPEATWRLYRNVTIRRTTNQVVAPLRSEGIEQMVVHSDETAALRLSPKDADAFEPSEEAQEQLTEQTVDMAVSLASVAFTEGNKWRLSDGEHTFYAAMQDSEFRRRMDQGEVAFRKGDVLICRMNIRQVRSETVSLSSEYAVERVIEHIPASQPLRLFDIIDGGDEESG